MPLLQNEVNRQRRVRALTLVGERRTNMASSYLERDASIDYKNLRAHVMVKLHFRQQTNIKIICYNVSYVNYCQIINVKVSKRIWSAQIE